MLVLGKLKWDLAAVIAHDFLALILHRLSLPSDRQALVKKHAQTFLALCATGNISRYIFAKSGKSRLKGQGGFVCLSEFVKIISPLNPQFQYRKEVEHNQSCVGS